MEVIFFALIAYFGWGVGDVFGTIASRKIGGYSTTFWYLVFAFILFSLFSPFFIDSLKNLTIGLFLINILLGCVGSIGLVAFYEGVRKGNAALVSTITGSAAVVAVILGVVFFQEDLSIQQIVAIAIIMVGLILSTLELKKIQSRTGRYLSILLGFVAMFSWGIYQAFIKIPVGEIGWFWAGIFALSSFPLILLFMRMRAEKLNTPLSKGSFLPLILNVILLGGGTFSFYRALELGQIAVVTPIANSYPTIFVILAFILFKDPITKQQMAGIITTLLGIVLLSIVSV